MGDRAVVGIKERTDAPTLYVYLHWAGSVQDELLAIALEKAMPRILMKDGAYAQRIIVSQMVGDQWDSELGAGLYVGGTWHGGDYDTLKIVDIERQVVMTCAMSDSGDVRYEVDIETFLANVRRRANA